MKKPAGREIATEHIKVFPRTHRRLKVQAAEEDKTMAELVEEMSAKRPRRSIT